MLVLRAHEILLLHRLGIAQLDHGRFQPLLRLLALGDVADADADAEVSAAAVGDRAPVGCRPELGPVLALAAELVVLSRAAAQRAVDLPHGAHGVGLRHARRREARHGQAFLRRVAEHVEHARVDPDQPSFGVDPALAVVAVVGDRGELGFTLGERLDAAGERRRHRVERVGELAHFVAPLHRQPHREVAGGQALARLGELGEVAGKPVRKRDHQNDGQEQREHAIGEVFADELASRGLQKRGGNAEMHAAELTARGLDIHRRVQDILPAGEPQVGHCRHDGQRAILLPAGARHRLAVAVEHHQVADTVVAPDPLEDLAQGVVLAVGEGHQERRGEQLVFLLQVDPRALVQLRFHDADAVDDQQRQHHRLHQRPGQQQPRAQ